METIRAQWMPVFIEPIPFSGERLCAAIAFRADDGQTRVISTMPHHAIHCLFGHEAAGMSRLVQQLTSSLDAHVRSNGGFNTWHPPFEGVHRGDTKAVRETSMDVAIQVIVANVASLSQSEPSPKAVDRSSLTWAQSVQKAAPSLAAMFNVQLMDDRNGKITVGFVSSRLAAEFAALNVSGTWSSHSATFYRKLINLKLARSYASMFSPEHFEILLRTPDPATLDAHKTERYENLMWDAERSATSLDIKMRPYWSPESAAHHLHQLT